MENYKNLAKNKEKHRNLIIKYSGLFLFISSLIILYLFVNGKTNINRVSDGMNQHYRALLYYSRYLKSVVSNLLINHQLIIPQVDFSFGEGADILSALHYHGAGDPIMLLSVFVPDKQMFYFYLFNAFIRVYLAGLFFIELCIYFKKTNSFAILSGSLSYAFCFFSLSNLTHHICFITPIMITPLIILGLEKILDNEKPFVFIIAVFWGATSNIYYLYMEAVVTIIYTLIRITIKYSGDFKQIFLKLLHISAYAVFAVCMAAVVVLPVAYSFINDSRMGIGFEISPLYPQFFYERLFTIFVSNDSAYDLRIGLVAPTLLTLALSFKNYKKHYCLSILHIISFIFVCIPYFSSVLNGFSFISQRWSFALALTISYTLVEEWDNIENNKKFSFAVMLMCFALTAYSAWSRNERVVIPMCFCLVFLIVSTSNINRELLHLDLKQAIMLILVVANILYIENYHLSARGGNALKELLSIEDAKKLPYTSEAYVMKNYLENRQEGFYRYTGNTLTSNASTTFGTYSTNYYWSISNRYDQLFRMDLGLLDLMSWLKHGYDNRAELESLANVKYYIAPESYKGIIPYGFELDQNISGNNIYINNYVLPFGYTYDNAVSYDEWNMLNALEKQQAMMEAIVVDKDIPFSHLEYNIENVNYSVVCSEGILFDKQQKLFIVEKENSSITIQLENAENNEYYLLLNGIDYEDIYNYIEDDHTLSTLSVETSNGNSCEFKYLPKTNHYYYGKSNYVGYLGYEKPLDEIKISFSLIGKYNYEDLLVLAKNMNNYTKQIGNLSKDHLSEIEFSVNKIKGEIHLDSDKYLLLSVPFSTGWKAYVDGVETEILQANQHYLGLELSSGKHYVELNYNTPGLQLGTYISVLSVTILIIYVYLTNKKTHK